MSGKICRAVFLLLFAFILTGCDRNRNTPGWDYFPDMFYSTAYETFTKNPNFKDGNDNESPCQREQFHVILLRLIIQLIRSHASWPGKNS